MLANFVSVKVKKSPLGSYVLSSPGELIIAVVKMKN